MKKNYTPGPWKVFQGVDQLSFPQTTICGIRYSGQPSFFVHTDFNDHGDGKADANLIASAPELLDALINQLQEIGVDPFGSIEGYSHKTQAAMLAVQKAIGEKENV